jgi:hypothetical protein
MADLSHYDLFTAFTLEEAAHLACGIDPKSGLSNTATATVEEAMRDGLNFWRGSCGIYAATQSDFAARVPDWVLRPTSLWPMFDSMFVPFKTEKDAWKSLNEDVFQNNDLTFSREELDRWFKAKGLGLKTQYEFVQRSTKQSPEAPFRTANE